MSRIVTAAESSAPEAVAERVGSLKLKVTGGEEEEYRYADYLPVWDKTSFAPVPVEDYVDPGSRADPAYSRLLQPGVTHREVTPALGTEIEGVQLSELSPEGLDDLALLAAQRGVVIFRGQDFKDKGIEKQLATVQHYGRLHVHPTMGHPKETPYMHVVYRDPKDSTIARYIKPNEVSKISSVQWHVDHSAELQPPGITFFFALTAPPSGGDTLFVSQTEAFDRLSEEFKKRLSGLKVVHSNADMLAHSASLGGPARFPPLETLHPLVRTHPVTGTKSLFIHAAHARRIHGYKQEESDYLYGFLNDVLRNSGDIQTRVRWEDGTVAVWDNRVVAHTATYDFKGDERRHVVRIAAHAETPFE
ncbi:hypothetical protein JCM10207_007315 [Rhodosporidiobolus poonsookiae]